MTYDEALEKYGDTPVRFSHYYKYLFTFKGVADDGTPVECSAGGVAEDVYRWTVEAEKYYPLRHFEPQYITIGDGDSAIKIVDRRW